MTWAVERYSADSLLLSDVGVRVMRPRLGDVDVHWHDYYELSLVTGGAADHVVNGERREVSRGHAFLLTPADFHELRVRDDQPLDCYNVVVAPHLVERHLTALAPFPGTPELPWHTADLLDVEPDLGRLERELDEPRLGSPCWRKPWSGACWSSWRDAAHVRRPPSGAGGGSGTPRRRAVRGPALP